jgi:hypothetical protein
MKTKILSLAILSLWSITSVFAQDRTTVTATNSDISDNLDLRAVASIFGDSRDLNDFEKRLNDPQAQISNLDLNGDNRVDYLRVIETVEGNVHLIIIQSVLGLDTFQDIATVEVERDRYNRVQVQVVGDVYMYGNNYIYEPVYSYTPVIYASFWVNHYRPYYSSWYWGYYPSFYVAWNPFPVYTYHSHIGLFINHHHHYNYVNVRRNTVAYNNYYTNGRRGNAYERQYPNRSFSQRNTGYSNRRELVDNRRTQSSNTRTNAANSNTRNSSVATSSPRPTRNVKGANEVKGNQTPRSNGTRDIQSPRSVTTQGGRDVTTQSSPRNNGNVRNNESPRTYGSTQNESSPRSNGSIKGPERTFGNTGNTRSPESPRSVAGQGSSRGNEAPGAESPRTVQRSEAPRSVQRSEAPRNVQRSEAPGNSGQREYSQQRGNSQRGGSEGNSRGNRRS